MYIDSRVAKINLTIVDLRDTYQGVKNAAQPELGLVTPSCVESIHTL